MSSTSAQPNLRASGLKGRTTAAIGAIRHLWGLTVPAGVSDAIVAALRWLNNPWKFLALLGFGVTGLFGAIIWDQRVTLVTVMVEPTQPPPVRLERERAILLMTRLLRETGGAIALVSQWDVDENRRTNIAAINRAGRALRVEPETLPIVRSPRLPAVVLPALMAGDVPCIQIPAMPPAGEIDRIPPDIRLLATSDGLTAYCVGPVNDRGALIGSLTVMFEGPPADPAYVAVAMRRAAVELLRPRETR
jgi:hypothetical protein